MDQLQASWIRKEGPEWVRGNRCIFIMSHGKESTITGAARNSSVTYSYGYLFTLMERKINLQSDGELGNLEIVQKMPSYPQNGSITTINGTVIVKFKNT